MVGGNSMTITREGTIKGDEITLDHEGRGGGSERPIQVRFGGSAAVD